MAEFLKVLVPERQGQDIDVLLNRRKNGKVGAVLLVSRGTLRVSVDLDGAVEQRVTVKDTRADAPLVVEIEVQDKDGEDDDR